MSDSPTDPDVIPGRPVSGELTGHAGAGGRVRGARRGGSGAVRIRPRRRAGKHADAGHELGVLGGLSALSLDALSSVAYGPEAMMLVLVLAGSSALRFTLPLTLVITGMLALLVISYTQVISAYPDGGGAYAVAKANLGRWPALLAAASLVVDYVLTVAVSLAAGAASLGSAFPALSNHLLLVSVIGLVLLTAVNMFGISESARLLMGPALLFVVSTLAVIVIGLVNSHTQARIGRSAGTVSRHRGDRGDPAAQGVRHRLLGGDRCRGDRQRRARLPASRAAAPASGPRSRWGSCSRSC